MKKLYILLILLLFCSLSAKEPIQNSRYELPLIVMVGQVINVTPHSIIVENTKFETHFLQHNLKPMIRAYSGFKDYVSHGFANSLKLVSINNRKMRLNFYTDNINLAFHNDLNTYMHFLPALYLVKNNIEKMTLPKDLQKKLSQTPLKVYLTLPAIKKIMKKSWFAGVFQIHPDSGKLVFHDARFFPSYEKMMNDPFTKEFMIDKIVKKGMVLSTMITMVKGNEKSKSDSTKDKKKPKQGDKNTPLFYKSGGTIKRNNR